MLDDSDNDSEDEGDCYKIPARKLMAATLNSYVAWDSTVALGGIQKNLMCLALIVSLHPSLLRPS